MAISNKLVAFAILLLFLAVVVSCDKDSKKKKEKDHKIKEKGEEKSAPEEENEEEKKDDGKENPAPGGEAAALPATSGSIPVSPGSRGKVFNVLDFGVKTGANTDNAVNFIKAWRAACDNPEKSTLLFPKGEFHATAAVFQGPCKAPIDVEIQGTILAGSDISSYSEDFWLSFEKIIGLNVSGNGIIDGQGPNVWKFKEQGASMFPISLKFIGCEKITISGLTSINPMGFHFSIVHCDDVTATNIHLSAPEDSPNTDGVHISQSTNVRVFDSHVATGDDCVGVIHGSSDVVVRGVYCGPGHGLSIGSLGKYDDEKLLKNVLIENCTMNSTDNGARIKTYAGSLPSVAQNITFKDITMTNVSNPILIDQSYGKKSKEPSKVQISNAQFINIKGTTPTDNAVDIQCSKAVPCQGIRLSSINLEYIGAKKKPFVSNCTNAKITYDGPQTPPPC
ncbi:exopolygalacturonase-like [Euphorbia lathyris]|uniref:exopolygalacturonase-like n=1 Tax=Euphorbia lathyris TaxID=212925 RepID=UPI0033135CEC